VKGETLGVRETRREERDEQDWRDGVSYSVYLVGLVYSVCFVGRTGKPTSEAKKPDEPDEQAIALGADVTRILRVDGLADKRGRFQSQGLRRNGGTLWRGPTPNQNIGAEVGPIWPNDRP
jgi:hypothetical protein